MPKAFDLHYEVGIVGPGLFYARTVLGNGSVRPFQEQGHSPSEAMNRLSLALENAGLWPVLAGNPGITPYPFPSTGARPNGPIGGVANTKNTVQSKGNTMVTRKRPADLISIPHPDCESQCISFDNFGPSKCRSICAHRTGV
jgi:hypothetical protein